MFERNSAPPQKKFFKVGAMYIKNTVNPEINQSQKKFFYTKKTGLFYKTVFY